MKPFEIVLSCFIWLMLASFAYFQYEVFQRGTELRQEVYEVKNMLEVGERYALYSDHNIKIGANGVYHGEGYYCVWTRGRSLEAIHKTECHEVLHAAINGDFPEYSNTSHFCELWNG